jgi:hypothetical protein
VLCPLKHVTTGCIPSRTACLRLGHIDRAFAVRSRVLPDFAYTQAKGGRTMLRKFVLWKAESSSTWYFRVMQRSFAPGHGWVRHSAFMDEKIVSLEPLRQSLTYLLTVGFEGSLVQLVLHPASLFTVVLRLSARWQGPMRYSGFETVEIANL